MPEGHHQGQALAVLLKDPLAEGFVRLYRKVWTGYQGVEGGGGRRFSLTLPIKKHLKVQPCEIRHVVNHRRLQGLHHFPAEEKREAVRHKVRQKTLYPRLQLAGSGPAAQHRHLEKRLDKLSGQSGPLMCFQHFPFSPFTTE